MEDFRIKITPLDPKNQIISLYGYLDESAQLPNMESIATLNSVTFDFKGCGLINSAGVKKWVIAMAELEAHKSLQVYFRNCPPMIVEQFKLIHGFLPAGAKVESVYLPIFCEKCDKEFRILKEAKDIKEDMQSLIDEVKDVDCEVFPKCRKHFDLDFHPQSIQFLKDVAKP